MMPMVRNTERIADCDHALHSDLLPHVRPIKAFFSQLDDAAACLACE